MAEKWPKIEQIAEILLPPSRPLYTANMSIFWVSVAPRPPVGVSPRGRGI